MDLFPLEMPVHSFFMDRFLKNAEGGEVYVCTKDTPADQMMNEANFLTIYKEENGEHTAIGQPIILNQVGLPIVDGSVAKILCPAEYALAVYDAYGVQQFYFPNVLKQEALIYTLFPKDYTLPNIRQLIRDREAALVGNKVRFVTWNTQGYNSVYTYYGKDFANQQRVTDLTEWFLRMEADFVGSQEVWSVPDQPDRFFAQYPYISAFQSVSLWEASLGRRYGNLAVSTRALNNSTFKIYNSQPVSGDTDKEPRSYIRTEITVAGTTIAIYVTHLSLNKTRINEEIAELALAMQNDTATHIVAMGDWNTDVDADFAPFTDRGFTMVNRFGEFNTNNVGNTWYLDRIFYKGFSAEDDRGVFDTPVSLGDHKALYVDLVI